MSQQPCISGLKNRNQGQLVALRSPRHATHSRETDPFFGWAPRWPSIPSHLPHLMVLPNHGDPLSSRPSTYSSYKSSFKLFLSLGGDRNELDTRTTIGMCQCSKNKMNAQVRVTKESNLHKLMVGWKIEHLLKELRKWNNITVVNNNTEMKKHEEKVTAWISHLNHHLCIMIISFDNLL